MKKLLAIALAAGMALSLTACGSKETQANATQAGAPADSGAKDAASAKSEDAEKVTPKIGVAISSWTTNAIFVDANRRIQKEAEENGWEYQAITLTEDNCVSTIENFINAGCNIVMIQANKAPEAFSSKIDEMLDAGICVIEYDSEYEAEKDTFFLSLDNYGAGKYFGEIIGEWCNENIEGEAIIGLGNRISNETFKYRAMGIADGIEETIKNGGVKLQVETQPGTAEGGMKAGEDLLSGLPDMNVCVMWNGGSGAGAYEALKGANWDGALFSFDCSQEEVQAMLNGDILKGSVSTNCAEELLFIIKQGVAYVENGFQYTEEQLADDTLIHHYFVPVMVWQEDAAKWLLEE
ncbi:MAG: substrate-binding domain-containing protein [Lachnospiraceae bacterium]|nr:substrate-binding domain-containing protein [Lachnospiraceae bacterium]